VKVIPYGIDIGYLPPPIQIPTRFSETIPLRIGFIGTLSKVKGPHVILNALSLLRDKTSMVTLDVYGKVSQSDPYYQVLQEKVKVLDSRVNFKGIFPPERIGEVLRKFHLIVVPSLWYESAPLVLCSALKAGTPALVSRLEGMTELIDEGANGFSFPAGDADQLRKIIVNILENPSILIKIQRNMKVSERSASTYTREIESEYLEVISKNPKG
jgi:glycosyltransferase involved in cell wall biosynthesis